MRATARAPASPATPPMSAIRRQNPALCHRTTRPSPHHIGPSHRSMPSHHFNSAVTFASCLSLACSHHRNPSRRHSIVRLGWHPPSRRLPSTCPQASARGSLRVRFNRDDPAACWGWLAALFESGYPAIADEPPSRAMLLGHRVSHVLHIGRPFRAGCAFCTVTRCLLRPL
jgi:hypothetical protein